MTDLDTPRWASIPDAHDYLVSDDGQVRRILPGCRWRTIRPARNSKGYLKVDIGWQPCPPACDRHRNSGRQGTGHRRQEYVHRLVWMAFRGVIPDDHNIDHRDGNQLHNSLPNLRAIPAVANVNRHNPGWGARDDHEQEDVA